jgi:hypothetical protein
MTGATVILPAPTFAINATIIYPNTGSTFGPAQCWILTELYTVINGTPADSSASSICRLYYWDGYANTSYNLVQTLNAANASPTFNFTAINVSGAYRINCTVFVDTYNASSQNVDISIIGTSLCTTTPTPSGNTTTTYILSNVFDSEINTQGYGVFTLLLGMYVLIVIIFPSVLKLEENKE